MRGRTKPTPPERRRSLLDISRVMSRTASLTSMASPTPSWKDLDLAQASPASQRQSPSGVPNVTSWLSVFQQVSPDAGRRVGALSTFADVARMLQQRKLSSSTSRSARASGAGGTGRQGGDSGSERESIALEESEPVAFEVLTVADVAKQLLRDRRMSTPARRHPSWCVMTRGMRAQFDVWGG